MSELGEQVRHGREEPPERVLLGVRQAPADMVNGVLRRLDADAARFEARLDRGYLRDLTERLLTERGGATR